MYNYLSSIINIDLHIHSKASEYKEAKGYVDDSNIDNLEVLFDKLQHNNINMFSISDHNNFDFKLYTRILEILDSKLYPVVYKVLPAVEFDVQLEENKDSCHIVTIFRDDDIKKIAKISEVLEKNPLRKVDDFYKKDEFELILKLINLDVLLIAHQHTGMNYNCSKKKKTRSLTESTSNSENLIKIGYINALEFQQSKVQGIIINSLRKSEINIATLIGSDCHQWKYYPLKDKKSKQRDYVSKIKALPTFDGLLFSLTSPATRFNRNDYNIEYIKSLSINNIKIPLSKGINTIIGDNGSGKSMLLDLLNDEISNYYYYKKIIDLNKIKYDNKNLRKIYVKQNSVIEKVKKGTLFKNDDIVFYNDILTKERFKKRIKNYFEKLISSVNKNIMLEKKYQTVMESKLEIKINTDDNYIPHIDCNYSVSSNFIFDRFSQMNDIYESLYEEYSSHRSFYNNNYPIIKDMTTNFKKLLSEMKIDYEEKERMINIQNSILFAAENFNRVMNLNKSDKQKSNEAYKLKKEMFITNFVSYLKESVKENKFPEFPKAINGTSKNRMGGYDFVKITKYSGKYLFEEYFNSLFNNGTTLEKIKMIKTSQDLVNVLNGIRRISDIEQWYSKIDNLSEKYCKEETYIQNSKNDESIGKTPGEVSMVYYSYILKTDNKDVEVILIDQPEDDISNKNIATQLLSYLNENRDKKQVIIVTHNPILVVNLDVDNVIYINKDKFDNMTVKNGCLEYSCSNYSIIKEVAENMDGGIELVERRFKLYGKSD